MSLFNNRRQGPPPGGPGHGPGPRPGIGGGILGGLLNSASSAIGAAAGVAIGNAVEKVADQAADNVTADMQMNTERKQMALEQEKKAMELPTHCPHCGAGTNGKLICDYCDCKIVE